MPTVLITGTSKGIGLATALAFARAGYQVHATMRNPEATPELAQMAARENLKIVITKLDVDSDQSVAQGIAAILQAGACGIAPTWRSVIPARATSAAIRRGGR